jgi:hypothetical protein
MNCCMIRRALDVAVGLFAICFPVAAQQANSPRATEPAFGLGLYQSKALSAKANSLLFHKGPVRAWSDGGRLASENALASLGMASLDLFPVASLPPPNAFEPAPTKKGSAPSDSRSEDFAADGKNVISPDEIMVPPPDRIYYGGEIGFMYGRWSGKGSGDMMESYIMGQVGNDHFQITAGAEYEQWSGNGARFRSFALPR